MNSTGESSSAVCHRHSLASIGSEVGLGSVLVKYGGLLNEQQLLLLPQPSPSQRGSSGWKPTESSEVPDSQK
ncbi:hypothetical protein GBAR_LOCUS31620 [Geodia barretti]|uniref:Uncharacterized protein n=1 Tax=Geodia barretti TaxID=519541 RepID=A0AA35U110_GEOBA|nr:hypothetical protein GBAR_LOCUS31620 [Geodia barretti]